MSDQSAPAIDSNLLDEAVAWAKAAGEFTLELFRTPDLDVDRKGDGSPVTVADRGAERLLRELIEASYPDDSILGEEEADRIGSSGRKWVIDPIDGTKAFTHGVGLYSNLLYLEDEHGPAIGVINLPALGETVYAGRGLGCFMNGTPCRVSDREKVAGSYLSTTWFYGWTPDQFAQVNDAGMQLRTWGDAYGYALVATGRIEAMYDPVLAWWDLASLLVIIPEAGGVITTTTGTDAKVAQSDGNFNAIASNGKFHNELIAALAIK